MAIVIEDGTGLANAEAYIAVADADLYFSLRGEPAWALLDVAAKEAALRKATDYMQGAFDLRWKGSRVTQTQALSWPRSGVWKDGFLYASNSVPLQVARANAELALRASASTLQPDLGAQVTQETVGPISVSYAAGARQSDKYVAVDSLLLGLLTGSGQVPVVRA